MSALYLLLGAACGACIVIAAQVLIWQLDRNATDKRLAENKALRALDGNISSAWIVKSDLVVGEEDAAEHVDFWRKAVEQ